MSDARAWVLREEMTGSPHSGYRCEVIRAALALVILGIVFVPLEKLRPVRRGQRVFRPGVRTDVIHFLVTAGTYHAPTQAWPETYGIDHPMPAGYLRQLQSPFVTAETVVT